MADETDTAVPMPTTPPIEPTPEQVARAEKMAPLVELVQSPEFEAVWSKLQEIHTSYMGEPLGYPHVFGVMSTMPRLKEWAEAQ